MLIAIYRNGRFRYRTLRTTNERQMNGGEGDFGCLVMVVGKLWSSRFTLGLSLDKTLISHNVLRTRSAAGLATVPADNK